MTEKQLKEIQEKLIDIIVYFDEFCKKHDIIYYLDGGSALGAIRHNGFIPWDDDFDVLMTYENYNKFLEKAKTELDTSKFYLQKEDTEAWPFMFTKLRMNGCTCIEDTSKNLDIHSGFYIDIFCKNNAPQNLVMRYLQYVAGRLVVAYSLSKTDYIPKSFSKQITIFISRFLIRDYIKNKLVLYVRKWNKYETKKVSSVFDRCKFETSSFSKEILGTPVYHQFENLKLPIPVDVHEYMHLLFGDGFMDIPNEETKNKYPSHVIFYDTKIDYKEYIGKVVK